MTAERPLARMFVYLHVLYSTRIMISAWGGGIRHTRGRQTVELSRCDKALLTPLIAIGEGGSDTYGSKLKARKVTYIVLRLILPDQVCTPDSSRYWSTATYEQGKPQDSFDKQ